MTSYNELLKKRDQYPRGSDKWRELNRASLHIQIDNQVNNVTRQLGKMPGWSQKSTFEREDYAADRASNWLMDYARRQKEGWLQRDIKRVRDDLKTTRGR